jgi:hypothetical protein
MNRDMIEQKVGKTWDTNELQKVFEVLGFSMGCCVVRNRETGKRGSLEFDRFDLEGAGATRLYHSFVEG